MDFNEFAKWCAALCAWREARGEGPAGIRAVLHVIANRAKAQSKSWADVVYAKLQFSSMTYGQDPQLCAVPKPDDGIFLECYRLADRVMSGQDEDPTLGATFYFAPAVVKPAWAAAMTKTVSIGHHDFFKP